jgi:hypothetical protein
MAPGRFVIPATGVVAAQSSGDIMKQAIFMDQHE